MTTQPTRQEELKREFNEVFGDYTIKTLPIWQEDKDKFWSWFSSKLTYLESQTRKDK